MSVFSLVGRSIAKVASEFRSGLQYYDPQEQAWSPKILEMGPTRSGTAISEVSAMKCLTVFACVRAISEDIAKLPMHLYEHLKPRGKERVRNDVSHLFTKQPNPEMSAYDFKRVLQAHVLQWGNGFAEIEFNNAMQPIALWPLPPDRIKVVRAKDGTIVYEIRPNYIDNPIRLPAWKIFHLKGLGFDGLVGYSPIRLAAESIGITMAQEQFAASFFGNGAYPGVILKHPMRLSEEAEKRLKHSFEDAFRGADNAHRTFVMQEGMTADKMTLAPEEAQFLESRQFSTEEIARLFRVPPHKIGHLERATFANIEQQNTEYVTDCLMPHAIAWEQESDRKLNLGSGQFFQHKFNELLRGDAVARGTFYAQMRMNGIFSTNDIRDMENMNPVGTDGDTLLVQGAMISLETVTKGQQPNAQKPNGIQNDGKPVEKDPKNLVDAPITKQQNAAKLAKIAENHEIMLAETLGRALKIESERALKASKKPGFEAWKSAFYAEHESHLVMAVRSIVFSLCEAGRQIMDAEINAPELCNAIAARHGAESKRGLTPSTAETAIMGWNETRAQRFAKDEIGKIVQEMIK